jgi:hypothetical protein
MYYIVLKRGEYQRFDLLHKAFGSTTPVIWDRRARERRRSAGGSLASGERRRGERRSPPPASWTGLGFVVIQQEIDPGLQRSAVHRSSTMR